MIEVKEMLDAAKAAGYTVIAPEELSTYFWITDGTHIGYAQADRLRGPTFSTVHKANKHTGTGYHADSMEESLAYKPRWVTDGVAVPKWSGPNEFIAKHWQPLKQY